MRLRFWAAALAAALALGACAPAETPSRPPPTPAPAGAGLAIEAAPVPLDPDRPARTRIGRFAYAGGVWLTSEETSRLHGLSDLKVWPGGRLLSVGDEGDLLEARLVLDGAGSLAGVTDAKLSALRGEDGQPLATHGKAEADAEGIAEFANGDRLVSLECDDRILFYPHAGGPPRRAPAPRAKFPYNRGMEGLAQSPDDGPDAYLVGAESGGQTWLCRLSGGCTPRTRVRVAFNEGLSALTPLADGRTAYLVRGMGLRGVYVDLRILAADGSLVDELRLAKPLTVDNYEGLAALPNPDGSTRFYLISDDNFSASQRTLLVAFDWR